MAKKNKSEQNLSLFPDTAPSWETNGIFSEHFIRSRLKLSSLCPTDEIAWPIYEYLKNLWDKKYLGLAKGDEEITKREFLEKVFTQLGYSFLPSRKIPVANLRRVPDYILFQGEEIKEKVFNLELTDQFREALCLLEAKKVNHPLDAVSKKETPGRFPHQQVRDYLNEATDSVGNPFFKWAILTNGGIWRLYNRDSRPSAYFQFKLAGQNYFCTYEDFKVFLSLFQAEVFIRSEGLCPLDDIRSESIQFQTNLEEDLRKRAFSVLEDLANGFWGYKDNNLSETGLEEIYNNCLVFLYRLLFVLYAESRSLLPVRLYGTGSNKNYKEKYSLQRFIPKLKQEIEFFSDEFTEWYEQLLNLFKLINGDQPSRNKACNVPPYNGGLFDPSRFPNLEKWRIGDKSLSRVLRDLLFSSGPSERGKQQEFDWGTIDYTDLEVRQLGDIYEGLLGGSLVITGSRLALNEEYKKRQSTGTFYTPDFIVKYLVEETLSPLLEKIESNNHIKEAVESKRKDNSFANAVLNLNVVDPAMGSGHFLVRASEWLADKIFEHPTTKFQVEFLSPGLSQEQAEISYWRRRVVETCIYGIDCNPLAIELAKLSLWLTCIASNEPLSFLDHHLRLGNSLIGAKLEDLTMLPSKKETPLMFFKFGPDLTTAVTRAIQSIKEIESGEFHTLEAVKKKEILWQKEVINRLKPFKTIGNIWSAVLAGMELDNSQYHRLANYLIMPSKIKLKEFKEEKEQWEGVETKVNDNNKNVDPFHWELEFPAVFFDDLGSRKENPGFDAVLGNPPYISTQSSSAFSYRKGLELLFGFIDDLYVHFVFQGVKYLRNGGRFGFIISDTFFTLSTKLRLRELFQNHRLLQIVQCNPFKATVDAAIFVLEKNTPKEDEEFIFIQARHGTDKSRPEDEMTNLIKGRPEFKKGKIFFKWDDREFPVYHANQGCLRIHRTQISPYRNSLKRAFFEPTEAIVHLYNRFMEPMTRLTEKWWDKIETSRNFSQHRKEILEYHKTLKPGDVTLVGLIAEGGQGLATGNNGRFLGFLEGTEKAQKILERRKELIEKWNANIKIGPIFNQLLKENYNNFESVVETLKERFDQYRELGLKKGEIYQNVQLGEITDLDEFNESRKSKIINQGIKGNKKWLPFRKGDNEGNKWTNDEQLFICWSESNVKYLSTSPKARWQGQEFFFKPGVAWTRGANHACLKARAQEPCIYDVGGMQISPLLNSGISHLLLLSIFNSDIFSFILKKFVAHTWMVQINDIRQMPIIIPLKDHAAELENLGKKAIESKELSLKGLSPTKRIVDFCFELSNKQKIAPQYLQPPKQLNLITTTNDCLNIIELAVHWAVEKLYGVEGFGPFNEF